jgi:hypothetical protein
MPVWVDLSKEVDGWATAADKDAPPNATWTRPDELAPMVSLQEVFVDTMLSLSASGDGPAASKPVGKRSCDAGVLTCLPHETRVENTDLAATIMGSEVAKLVTGWQIPICTDVLDSTFYLPAAERNAYMAMLVEAITVKKDSCKEGCPFGLPLCEGGKCIALKCADVKRAGLCEDYTTNVGNLARAVCSRACECNSARSALFFDDESHGCLPQCVKEASDTFTCWDIKPNWPALQAFAQAPAVVDKSTGYGLVINATGWEALGCFAVNVEFFRAEVLCDLAVGPPATNLGFAMTFPAGIKRDAGKKSFMSLCPVMCGCLETPTLPGCPVACKSYPKKPTNDDKVEPTCHDLSDTGLAVLNERILSNQWNLNYQTRSPDTRLSSAATVRNNPDRFTRLPLFPPTCVGVDAAACTALGFDKNGQRVPFWKHPCPVACGVCVWPRSRRVARRSTDTPTTLTPTTDTPTLYTTLPVHVDSIATPSIDPTGYTPPPTKSCTDLPDTMLALANERRESYNRESRAQAELYPSTCSGINKTVCAALSVDLLNCSNTLSKWQHPCPEACGLCSEQVVNELEACQRRV